MGRVNNVNNPGGHPGLNIPGKNGDASILLVNDDIKIFIRNKEFLSIKDVKDVMATLIQRVGDVEVFTDNVVKDIPEFTGSFNAIQGGMRYHEVYRTGNALKSVGTDLAVTLISFKAETHILVVSPDVYLIDPYQRGTYAENGLTLTYTGIVGDATLLTTMEEPITIDSADIDGFVNTNTIGFVTISGAPAITGLYAPSSGNIEATNCASLIDVSVGSALDLDFDGCTSLPEIIAPVATEITAIGCTALGSVVAPELFTGNFVDCALTTTAIEALLLSLVATGKTSGTLNLEGGTNADLQDWSQDAQDALTVLQDDLDWTISYNSNE